jgi:hypothetical protein
MYSAANQIGATELSLLNRILMQCGLRPVSSVATLLPESDAYYAHWTLHEVLRNEMEKGWYVFNKFDEVEITVSPTGAITAPYSLYKFEISARTRQMYPDFPTNLYVSPIMGDTVIRPRYNSDAEVLQRFAGREVYFDIVAKLTPVAPTGNVAPDVFLNYCAAKAAAQFAPMVGGAVPKEVIHEATDQLLRAEAHATPRSNVYNDDPGTALVWMNR